ncbi:MAG: hypothetical protein H5T33_06440 [Candidatus Methanosuratus sp.]|nr:hypothetical protein [Candidatus Methanosuratincola sp.]
MVKLLGMEISSASFAFRVISGVVLASGAFLILYFIPANLARFITAYAPDAPQPALALLPSFIGPIIQVVGLALVPVIFLCALLRGTKAYGPLTIVLSLLSAAYIYSVFHGGVISALLTDLPLGDGMLADLHIAIDLTWMMIAFLVPTILGLIKGVVLTLKKG